MKKVLFCLPGRQYSGNFLKCWTNLLAACMQKQIAISVSQHYSPVVYFARTMCLGGDYNFGTNQKPFQGSLDYDYIMWIDSDILFTPEHFFSLLDHDKDIVSGVYMMADNKHYAVVESWDNEKMLKEGNFEFLNREKLAEKDGLFKVAYAGFGWMLIKKGVFESLEYPWFRPMWTEFTNGDKTIKDFASEDATFCRMIAEKGFDVWVDPKTIVGHEKTVIL